MIITCENCNTSFNLDESLLRQTGSKVRCSKCKNIFTAYPETIADMPDETSEKIYTTELEDVKKEIAEGDVSNIEKIEEEAITEDKPVEEELDLYGLKLEDEAEPEEAGGEPEKLELELDTEPVEKIEEKAITEDKPVEEKLDLYGLKLEDEAEPEEAGGEPEKLELELDTEPVEKIEEKAITEDKPVEEELDLYEIEEMLDLEDKPRPEGEEEPEELNLELDADMEAVAEETIEKAKAENVELEFEGIDQNKTAEEQPSEEIEKNFTETVELEAGTGELKAEEIEELSQDEEEVAEEEKEKLITADNQKSAGKKRISTPLLILFIVVLLAGGAYGTYVVLDSMNIKIPFVSDFLKPGIQDPGNLKITALNINGKFVDNTKIGKLFVITGKIKNEYPKARSFIKATGKLYTKGKTLAKSATVYCGNTISEAELASLDINEINKILSNRLGTNKTNVNIKPGKQVPFMIIFTNIPDNIEEYTIEVTGSSPA
ncbi:MAG: hypothetical protein SRB1_02848 [Desulfobacteraceae bacterium Eth-SRB1]|nr:MAG: hypothetical protein SRB1_02848 [Desulfobacteraceae bacterium Eth-SRB1]